MITNKTILRKKLWLPCSIALIVSLIVIPVLLSLVTLPITEPLGINAKNGDRIFYNFLAHVKKTKSVLIIGTSETANKLNGNNYWALLDKDKELNKNFYALGGAGRCSYTYFPHILENPSAFENLEIIYYINPTYWRVSLNNFNVKYYNRYVDKSLAFSNKEKAEKMGIYKDYFEPGIENPNVVKFSIDRMLGNYKSFFSSDLKKCFDGSISDSKTKETSNITISGKFESFKNINDSINLNYNALQEFVDLNKPFPSIDSNSSFQSNMLLEFTKLIDKYNIKCTFYLGPFNQVYCNKMNPEKLQQHLHVIEEIRQILELRNASYIDGSYQSTITGTFIDIQHISEYGAYLTAFDIKKYYEKNN